jgi:hypothetical protein
VEGADVSHEYDGGDVVEALDPFLALVTLPANVKYVEVDAVRTEFGFDDAVGLDTGSQHVLVVYFVVGRAENTNAVEKV